MNKLFAMFLMATLCLSFVSCGDDEPKQTTPPVITFDVQESQVVVTATGDGEVLLYIDGESTTNPTILLRKSQDHVHTFTATAQVSGERISETATLEVTVPSSGKPLSLQLESVYENESDTHYKFDIDMGKDSSTIIMYNVVFRIGEATSPAMTLRVAAPLTVDSNGKTFTYTGTGIVADMLRGTTWMPMPGEDYLVHNLTCEVNTETKHYSISFDCHGGHFDDSGQIE